MNKQCDSCNTRIHGYSYNPATCDCLECFCEFCWNKMFAYKIEINGIVFVKEDERVIPKCLYCGIEYKEDEYNL